jgi:hypothetical protein
LHPVHGLGERFKQERLTASWDKWPLWWHPGNLCPRMRFNHSKS